MSKMNKLLTGDFFDTFMVWFFTGLVMFCIGAVTKAAIDVSAAANSIQVCEGE